MPTPVGEGSTIHSAEKEAPIVVGKETKGREGVRRFTFRNEQGKVVGTARMCRNTIGEIRVKEHYQRQGFGTSILKELRALGGTSGFAGSEAGAALMKKAGMADCGGGRFEFPGETQPASKVKGMAVARQE